MHWEKNGKPQLSNLYADMLNKYLEDTKSQDEKKNHKPIYNISHRDVVDEVSSFAYSFRLKHKTNRQKKMLVLEQIEEDMKELWLALDFGVTGCILSGEKGDDDEFARYQSKYERGISSLTERNFEFFLIGSVLWERRHCPEIILEVLYETETIISKHHDGDCATCLAADACNHPCFHD